MAIRISKNISISSRPLSSPHLVGGQCCMGLIHKASIYTKLYRTMSPANKFNAREQTLRHPLALRIFPVANSCASIIALTPGEHETAVYYPMCCRHLRRSAVDIPARTITASVDLQIRKLNTYRAANDWGSYHVRRVHCKSNYLPSTPTPSRPCNALNARYHRAAAVETMTRPAQMPRE